MNEKLAAIESAYRRLERDLCDPSVAADPDTLREKTKKLRELEPIVEAYTALNACKNRRTAAEEALSDPDLKELAQEEILSAKNEEIRLTRKLRELLLPRDPDENRSVILEIRAGTGGEEAALFAADLLRAYVAYAQKKRFSVEIISASETQLGGIKEVTLSIEGDGAYALFRYESGVHRVQRVPQTESQGRIQTSAATVAVLPEAEEIDIRIDPKDLSVETHRSAGAGGQHVNKTESAIRVIHIPTGIEVDCQDERSQHRNREKAMKILRSRLMERMRKERDEKIGEQRRTQIGSGDRSERIRTYNYPQGRVTDHRIGLTLYKLPAVLDGEFDEIVDALRAANRARRLQGEETE